ncbi:MAG: GNAT family N-acetyltransferase [Erysipelotrichales bacterium]|nr:GNAT family N-acetyltransferase [Erysipelotrichales bacterium]
MLDIKLIEPTMDYAEDIWRFRQEIIDSDDNDKFAGCGNLDICASPQEWIEAIRIGSDSSTCPRDKVPSNIYIAVRESDNKIIGVIDLRHHINHPILRTWGGHIGYYVRPDERKKGYATKMLNMNLENARNIGLKRVLITCSATNIASERTIVANGGLYDKDILVGDEVIKRFWIKL